MRSYCLSQAGATRVDQISFQNDPELIRLLLRQNLEFKMILEKGEGFPAQFFFDGDDWLKRIGLEGSFLEAAEFVKLAHALETILACRAFLKNAKEIYPELHRLSEPVAITSELPKLIQARIDENATVRDNASADLAKIRKRLRDEQAGLRRLADQMFRKAVENKWVPEGALPTIREGRLVIPVMAEHKRRVKGFILDESASGQTVFIEPAEMLDTNNEIRDLEHAEKREVIAILKGLTDRMREHRNEISLSFEFLGHIDFIRAKARFSRDVNADMPTVENGPALSWYTATHPLLFLSLKSKREVVPLNISLDPARRMLLLSGPNAGGKSVALKTVGLLQYMLQCGMLIPVSDRSKVGVFDRIFLDIGDQQSIENDLSTYSSHLRNMAEFIQSSNERSIVLMDELGSGTDPNFGGAIAQAVLEELLKKRVWGIATTHYYNLKLFAGQQPGIINGAMRFDDKNLVPLYILDIGKPGSSFALEIARKTGLGEETLKQAENLVGKDLAGFETLVRSLEREKQEVSERIILMEKQEVELKLSLSKYLSLNAELEAKKKEIIGRAKQEASELLKQTNREIEKTIRHIRENKAEKKETLRVRKGLETLTRRVTQASKINSKPEVIQEGDQVRITGQEGSGVVISVKGKTASVQFGDLKSLINVSQLEKTASRQAEKEPHRPLRSMGIDLNEKQARFNPTLDVRGKRAEEIASVIDQFMDHALLLGHGELRILHGKGEGVLRKVVREQLRRYKEIASVGDEHVERGGDGVTVVVLK